MKNVKNETKEKKGLFIVIAIAAFALIAVLGLLTYKIISLKSIPEEYRVSINEGAKEIKKVNKNTIVAAYYPDSSFSEEVNQIIAEFNNNYADYKAESKAEKMILHIDYQVFDSGDYLSYEFFKEEGLKDNMKDKEVFFKSCINKKTNQKVTLDDLFEGEYQKQLAMVFRKTVEKSDFADCRDLTKFYKNTNADSEIFKDFVIQNNNLVVYVNNDDLFKKDSHVEKVALDLQQMDFYFKSDLNCKSLIKKNDKDEHHLRYIDSEKPMIALTYDDGPHYRVTNAILDVLEQYDAGATFFIVGNRLTDTVMYGEYMISENRKALAREASLNMEIANHTYTHPYLHRIVIKLSGEDWLDEWNACNEAIAEIVDGYVCQTGRPTGGELTDNMKEVQPFKLVNWSLDTLDWSTHSADNTYDKVTSNIEDGDIVLMHDVSPSYGSHLATERFVPELSQTYQLVTVTDLFNYKGVETTTKDFYDINDITSILIKGEH